MVDQRPSFEIYHDPSDQDRPPTRPPSPPAQHATRRVLCEIKLPNWGTETHRGSALKHEILASQAEPSSQSDTLPPSGPSSEESKENVPSRPLKASPFKKSRMFSTPGLRCNVSPSTRHTPLSTSLSPSIPRPRQAFGVVHKWTSTNAAKEIRKP